MAKIYNGIDVSKWQGKIDWEKAKSSIDFAIIRLGFGADYLDEYAKRNISELNRLGIPYGVYWFSYAWTVGMAKAEAKKAIAFLKQLNAKLSYPVYFDWEYDSRKRAAKNGVNVNNELLRNMATAFCEEVEAAGYYAGIYANPDYIQNYFGEEIFKRFDLWLAHVVKTQSRDVHMWQYSFTGRIPGISGDVDLNRCMVDFPAIISGKGNVEVTEKKPTKTILQVAKEVIAGKYGNDPERSEKLAEEGYDPEAVQTEVNKLMEARAKPKAKYHTVQAGETLTLIAEKYDTTVSAILKLNSNIKNPDMIYEKQKIRVK